MLGGSPRKRELETNRGWRADMLKEFGGTSMGMDVVDASLKRA